MSLRNATRDELHRFVDSLRHSRRAIVLTGAGCSTASGIPDYRGPNGTWTKRRPMNFAEFTRSADSRRYFWARNYRGWPRFAAAEPNDCHHILAELEDRGMVAALITQNVDDLHRRAGQLQLHELHGQSNRVRCLGCGRVSSRLEFQTRLEELNADWIAEATAFNPDGDAEIDRAATASFRVPDCSECGGVMKPDVVFFGESVEKAIVERCMQEVHESDLLVVIGSSLAIWSGYRFAKAAHELGKELIIVNAGETRADELASLKIEADCVSLLRETRDALFA